MRLHWSVGILIFLSAVASAPGATAQAEAGTLFFTSELVDSSGIDPVAQNTCGSKSYGMTQVAPTEADGQQAAATPSYLATACPTEFTYVMEGATVLDGDATLTFFTSCDVASVGFPAGISSYRGHLRHNGEELSQATIFGGSGVCAAGSVEEQTMTLGTDDAEIAAGDTLSVLIYWWTTNPQGAAADNTHFLVYGTDTPSGLTAAGLAAAAAGGPEVVQETLEEGPEAAVALSLGNATNATYVYNWERDGEGPVQIGYQASLATGNASVTVADAANTTVLEAEFAAGDSNDTVTVEESTAGNWTITIVLADATGDLSVSIRPLLPPEPVTTPAAEGNATAEDDNGTALDNQTADSGGFGIPGFELVALVAAGAIAMALAARRRR
jgi:hypothetical protein